MVSHRHDRFGCKGARRPSFTLVEMLVAVTIIAILSSAILTGMYSAQEFAREARTKAQIEKIHALIMNRWQHYPSRVVPIRLTGANVNSAATTRLNALREMLRREMPDRKTDVTSTTFAAGMTAPAATRGYLGRAAAGWTEQYQGAECLYMILAQIRDGGSNGLDFFTGDEVGDVDNDGMLEVHDGWGMPIEFLRWAPGYSSNPTAATPVLRSMIQRIDAPDPFDPLKRDAASYAMYPLIYSAGPDRAYDIVSDINVAADGMPSAVFDYSVPGPITPLPTTTISGTMRLGDSRDFTGDGDNSVDNLTNHYVETN